MRQAPLLELREVEKTYGEIRALSEVSLTVWPGQVLGLLGPNGAGKSTLLRIVMDIISPDGGQVLLFGSSSSRRLLDRVGYLPEERGLYRKESVTDVLVYLAALKGQTHKEARKNAAAWLQKAGLLAWKDSRVEQLSKGMGQKVQLIATLMCEPQLLVLDEPFSGLDPISLREVRNIIAEQRRLGRGVILSTHQMNEVEDLCDSIALVHRGKILISGALEEVLDRASHGRFLVKSLDDVSAALQNSAPWRFSWVNKQADDVWVVEVSKETLGHELLHWLVTHGVRVERFLPLRPSLEEVFVSVLEKGN